MLKDRRKRTIIRLREAEMSYKAIARKVKCGETTVRRCCHNAEQVEDGIPNALSVPSCESHCRQCGKELILIPGKRKKLYCSKKCRRRRYE
ncbi:MAG: hypothetical protein WCR02_05745 [Sphaerochaetaceae bacterium]